MSFLKGTGHVWIVKDQYSFSLGVFKAFNNKCGNFASIGHRSLQENIMKDTIVTQCQSLKSFIIWVEITCTSSQTLRYFRGSHSHNAILSTALYYLLPSKFVCVSSHRFHQTLPFCKFKYCVLVPATNCTLIQIDGLSFN